MAEITGFKVRSGHVVVHWKDAADHPLGGTVSWINKGTRPVGDERALYVDWVVEESHTAHFVLAPLDFYIIVRAEEPNGLERKVMVREHGLEVTEVDNTWICPVHRNASRIWKDFDAWYIPYCRECCRLAGVPDDE